MSCTRINPFHLEERLERTHKSHLKMIRFHASFFHDFIFFSFVFSVAFKLLIVFSVGISL